MLHYIDFDFNHKTPKRKWKFKYAIKFQIIKY